MDFVCAVTDLDILFSVARPTYPTQPVSHRTVCCPCKARVEAARQLSQLTLENRFSNWSRTQRVAFQIQPHDALHVELMLNSSPFPFSQPSVIHRMMRTRTRCSRTPTIIHWNLGFPSVKLLQQVLKGATAPPEVIAATGELTRPDVPTFPAI